MKNYALYPLYSYFLFLSCFAVPFIGPIVFLFSGYILYIYVINNNKKLNIIYLLILLLVSISLLLVSTVSFTINALYILTIIYIVLLTYIYFKEINLTPIKNSNEKTKSVNKLIIKKGKNPISLSFLPILLFFTIYLYFFGFDEKIISEANTMIKKINDLILTMDKTNYDAFMISKDNVRLFVNLLPSIISSYAILISYTTVQLIAKKNNSLLLFKIPDSYIPIFIILGFCILANNNIFKLISINSLIIFSTLFFLQGFDILNYIINIWIKRPIFKIFIYVIIFTQLPFIILLILIGIFDNWFNFTNYIDKKNEK